MKSLLIKTLLIILSLFTSINSIIMAKDYKKISVVIVGHGAPANDFPKLKEYFMLDGKHTPEAEEIEEELRNWPRNQNNDPYWAGFLRVIEKLKKENKRFYSIYYAFNEMCAPTIIQALEKAYQDKPDLIIVTSIMFTPGGGHSEKDIPASIEMFVEEHPEAKIIYAWPYDESSIANFIHSHLMKFVN